MVVLKQSMDNILRADQTSDPLRMRTETVSGMMDRNSPLGLTNGASASYAGPPERLPAPPGPPPGPVYTDVDTVTSSRCRSEPGFDDGGYGERAAYGHVVDHQGFYHHGYHGYGYDYSFSGAPGSMQEYNGLEMKMGIDDLCPVCGDKVSGYHYGLLTCESCKGFFKRTVQNKKVYSCVDNRTCMIDKTQRKRCPYCRFQKCLSVGMKLEAVRSDRMRGGRNKFGPMYKRDRAIKQQVYRQRQQAFAQCQLQLQQHLSGGALPPGYMPPAMLPPHLGMEPPDIKPDLGILAAMNGAAPRPHPGQVFAGLPAGSGLAPVGMTPSPPEPHPHGGSNLSPQDHVSPGSSGDQPAAMYGPPAAHAHPHYQTSPGVPAPHSRHNSYHDHAVAHMPALAPHNTPMMHQAMAPPLPGHHDNAPLDGGGGGEHSPDSLLPLGAAHAQQPHVPHVIQELLAAEPNPKELSAKLGAIVESRLQTLAAQQSGALEQLGGSGPLPRELLQLVCSVCDHALFMLVEWARGASFFKLCKVEDQMKLLQNTWSEILVLDFIYTQTKHQDTGLLHLWTGHSVPVDSLQRVGLGDIQDKLQCLRRRLLDLKVDANEFVCLKFLILLNPDVCPLLDRSLVETGQERVNQALMFYSQHCYPLTRDKVGQLLMLLPELRLLAQRLEEYLLYRHYSGDISDQTLLMEILQSKRK